MQGSVLRPVVAPAAVPVLAACVVAMHPDRSAAARLESSRTALVRRLAAGDQAAMAEFYDQTHQMVYGLALRVLADAHAAEDVMVEVYAQAWRQAGEFDASRGSPSAWLLTMTRSRAIDARRARGRDRATEPLEMALNVGAAAPGPEALTVAAERHRFVHGALAHLSVELRQLIDLAYFGGLSHSEIAAQLGQPLGTVKTRIRSAMMQLRDRLAPLNAPLPTMKDTPS
mgnify:CR=1 FL=1